MARSKQQQAIVTATAEDEVYVGLDVHKASIHVAVWKNGRLVADWATGSDGGKLAGQLEGLRPGLRSVAYEAGPTGFTLARLLDSRGMPVTVCAPSGTPRPAVAKAKTDRLDAIQLAEYAAKGLLKAVTVPTEREEHERALVRRREDVVKGGASAMVKIKAALLYHGCGALRSWTLDERKRLLATELPDEVRFVLEGLFRELAFYEEEKKRVDAKLREVMAGARHQAAARRLQEHPGVGPVVSSCLVLELFRPERFKSGAAVARFVGLAPGKRQTGALCRGGPLLKAGQGKLRSLLVEAAWVWRNRDAEARAIYGRLMKNTRNAKKAIVGLARRLLLRLWKMLVYGKSYQPLARATPAA
jgi:transposase